VDRTRLLEAEERRRRRSSRRSLAGDGLGDRRRRPARQLASAEAGWRDGRIMRTV